MGRTSRDKGKRGEREFAALLREHGYDARRGVQYCGGPDSPDVTGLPGIHIEVKRTESLRLYEALKQSEQDTGEEMPIVAHRRNNCPWVIILKANDFMRLYKAWAENKPKPGKPARKSEKK